MVRNYSDREKTTQGQAARKCGILWAAPPRPPHGGHKTRNDKQPTNRFRNSSYQVRGRRRRESGQAMARHLANGQDRGEHWICDCTLWDLVGSPCLGSLCCHLNAPPPRWDWRADTYRSIALSELGEYYSPIERSSKLSHLFLLFEITSSLLTINIHTR